MATKKAISKKVKGKASAKQPKAMTPQQLTMSVVDLIALCSEANQTIAALSKHCLKQDARIGHLERSLEDILRAEE
jgi:hypothetical protein